MVVRSRPLRGALSMTLVAFGLALAAFVFDAGWPLPHVCDFEGGDARCRKATGP